MNLKAQMGLLRCALEPQKLKKAAMRIKGEAQRRGDDGIYDDWYSEHKWEFDINDSEISSLRTNQLIKQAAKFSLFVPDKSDGNTWEMDAAGSSWVFTSKFRLQLGAEIRKARRASIEWWIKIVGGVIGIITGVLLLLRYW